MTKHTPGPWRVVNTNSGLFIAGAEPGYFAEVFSGNKTTRLHVPEQHANAHLIACAPDMLAALEYGLGKCGDLVDCGPEAQDRFSHILADIEARFAAAIAKAEGR